MSENARSEFRIGDEVRVIERGRPSRKARIEAFLKDVEGGVRLDQRVNGFMFWNVADLRRA